MWLIFQVNVTASTPRGDPNIWFMTLMVWYLQRINTKAYCTCLERSYLNMGSMHTTRLCHLQTGIILIQRRSTYLINLSAWRVKEYLMISGKNPMWIFSISLLIMLHPIDLLWYKNSQGLELFYVQYISSIFIFTGIFCEHIWFVIFHTICYDHWLLHHCWQLRHNLKW